MIGSSQLRYGLTESPPWHLSIFLGLQHYLLMFAGTLALPVLLAPALCIQDNYVAISEISGTLFFVSGIITLMQCTIGVRLPLVQSGSVVFLVPAFAIMSLPKWRCPDPAYVNGTLGSVPNNVTTSLEQDPEIWQSRMRELQGAFIGSSLVEVLLGFSGLTGLLLRFLGPVCICPTIMLSGIALYKTATRICAKNWGVSGMTIVLIVLLAQYLEKIRIPIPTLSLSKQSRWKIRRLQIFGYFPVIIAMIIAWLVCFVLTETDVLSSDPGSLGQAARTDSKLDAILLAKWFRMPYPFQWGIPTVSAAAVLAMLSGVLAGVVDAVGDYYVVARLAGAPSPPASAVNRGIFIEGLGILLSGIYGTGNATVTYGQNIGAVAMTKVGSRRVIQVCAFLMILFGVVNKVGAVVISIPDPVIGGVLMVIFGFVVASGMIGLQCVDLNSNRNIFILGFSLFLGVALPDWMNNNSENVNTGNEILDQSIIVLLSNHMFIGGFVSGFLDNTVPGTKEERGLTSFLSGGSGAGEADLQKSSALVSDCYDLPFGMECINRWKWTRYLPISPTFKFGAGRPASSSETASDEDDPEQDIGLVGRGNITEV